MKTYVMKCDRCGTEIHIEHEDVYPSGWANVEFDWPGQRTPDRKMDVCPICVGLMLETQPHKQTRSA